MSCTVKPSMPRNSAGTSVSPTTSPTTTTPSAASTSPKSTGQDLFSGHVAARSPGTSSLTSGAPTCGEDAMAHTGDLASLLAPVLASVLGLSKDSASHSLSHDNDVSDDTQGAEATDSADACSQSDDSSATAGNDATANLIEAVTAIIQALTQALEGNDDATSGLQDDASCESEPKAPPSTANYSSSPTNNVQGKGNKVYGTANNVIGNKNIVYGTVNNVIGDNLIIGSPDDAT